MFGSQKNKINKLEGRVIDDYDNIIDLKLRVEDIENQNTLLEEEINIVNTKLNMLATAKKMQEALIMALCKSINLSKEELNLRAKKIIEETNI